MAVRHGFAGKHGADTPFILHAERAGQATGNDFGSVFGKIAVNTIILGKTRT